MVSLLAPLFYESAENKKIINFIKERRIGIDDESFDYNLEDIPFSYEEFLHFCDGMFEIHRDEMTQDGHGGILVSGNGIEVIRARGQGGPVTYLNPTSPSLS